MSVRIEAFSNGFLVGLKPQMTFQDREFFELVSKAFQTYAYSSPEERDPTKAAYYFRFRNSHLNVLLPVWLLNARTSSKSDRFRIGFTDDHSFIVDTKESIIYDPTTETAHTIAGYKPFLAASDWKSETAFLLKDDLAAGRFTVACLAERIEHIPELYDPFITFIQRHRLQKSLSDFRFGLDMRVVRSRVTRHAQSEHVLVETVLNELWLRASGNADASAA